MKGRSNSSRGQSDFGALAVLLGGAIAISVGYFVINWIISVKDARVHGKVEEKAPPPKSIQEMGSYEVTY
jgi:hypothetical protein